MTDTVAATEELEREKFEVWFRQKMYLGHRCFVDENNKRRMWLAWQEGAWQARALMEAKE